MSTRRSRRRALLALAAVLAALAAMLAGSQGAGAATGPVAAGLTLAPASAAVNQQVLVTATATNTTRATIALVSMGVDVPSTLGYGPMVHPAGGCRVTFVTGHRLVYCGVSNLAPGATATLSFYVTPKAAGSYSFRSYARQTYTTTDTFAYATLSAG